MAQKQTWTSFSPLTREDMRDTNHYSDFVCGYWLPLDGEAFRLFVGNETDGKSPRGHFLELMYKNGKIKKTYFDNTEGKKRFKQANSIFNNFPVDWTNKGRLYFCYKYVIFGKDKVEAVKLMESIKDYIKTLK